MLQIIFKILFVIMSLFMATNGKAQNKQTIQTEIQSALDSLQKTNRFPGVTLSVILPNNSTVSAASGFANKAKSIKMSTSHRMLSGSNGKTLFIAAALKLASDNYFKLDDKISTYLSEEPWFNRLPNANTITMRMLMNHTSGLEEYYLIGNFMQLIKNNPERSFTPIETFSYVLDRQALFEAGTAWGYADTNFILLGYILEKISGKKMYDLVNHHFIQTYQLKLTEPSTKMKLKNLATGYGRKGSPFPFEGEMVKNGKLVFNPQFEWMGGGFISNVADLALWSKNLYSLQEIKPDLLAEMHKKTPAKTGINHAYGLGIQIRPSENLGDSYGHSGWFPGYVTDAVYFPEKNMAIAIQFNTDDLTLLKKAPYDYLQMFGELILKYTTIKK